MSFATIEDMAGRRKNNYSEDISMVHGGPMGPPPAYKLDREDSLAPHWWDYRGWSMKKLLLIVAGLVLLVVIVIIIAVEVVKKNAYPNYSALTYTLTDTCAYQPIFLSSRTNQDSREQTPVPSSSITSTTLPATIRLLDSSTTFRPLKHNHST